MGIAAGPRCHLAAAPAKAMCLCPEPGGMGLGYRRAPGPRRSREGIGRSRSLAFPRKRFVRPFHKRCTCRKAEYAHLDPEMTIFTRYDWTWELSGGRAGQVMFILREQAYHLRYSPYCGR